MPLKNTLRLLALALAVTPAFVHADNAPAEAPKDADHAHEPAKEAAKPLAAVSPEVQKSLDDIAGAYRKLDSLELAGTASFNVEGKEKPRNTQATFTSAYQSPNKFKHQMTDGLILGSTGEKVYGYSSQANVYLLQDTSREKGMLSDLPEDHGRILPLQNLSLVLAISKDPSAELRQLATEISLEPDQKINDKSYQTLKLVLADQKLPMTVLLDPQTHLIQRFEVDMKPRMAASGRTDITRATYVVDYTAIKPGATTNADAFAFAPPQGAKDFATARAEAQAAAQAQMAKAPANALLNKPAPDFTLKGMDDKDVKLSSLKGSVVILDFWATWCGPCRAALPGLDKVYNGFKDQGLKVYALNQQEEKDVVQKFIEKTKLSVPVLFDAEGNAAKSYFVEGIPQQVLIGKDGNVKKVTIGYDPDGEDQLKSAVEKELKAK